MTATRKPVGNAARRSAATWMDRARAFLRSAAPTDTQGHAFRLLGLIWSGAPASEIRVQAQAVAALQESDGGWGQRRGMKPDAYATGQALYALEASGMTSKDAVAERAVRHLLRTQLPDGTW